MNEFSIKSSDLTFRIKHMNAIEILAMRTQFSNESLESTITSFKTILENIEVKCDEKWIPAKIKGREVYFPDGLENDINVVNDLISYFIGTFLKSVFQKSNASK